MSSKNMWLLKQLKLIMNSLLRVIFFIQMTSHCKAIHAKCSFKKTREKLELKSAKLALLKNWFSYRLL